jgi:superfamily II DNA helicase RecQ
MKKAFNWEHTPRAFQMSAISAQLQRKDVLIHAGTGYGKTAIAAGPHAHPRMKGKVTFLVSPLIALQEDQMQTLKTEFGLSAIAINSANEGLTKENFQVRDLLLKRIKNTHSA